MTESEQKLLQYTRILGELLQKFLEDNPDMDEIEPGKHMAIAPYTKNKKFEMHIKVMDRDKK